MSTTCPNGHLSATTDYCDECGARIAPTQPQAAPDPQASPDDTPSALSSAAVEAPAPTAPSPLTQPCPDCAAPRVGSDKFCEGCGYDFTTGKSSEHHTTPPGMAAKTPGSAHPPPAAAGRWEAIVSADRDYFESVAVEAVEFPQHCPDRKFTLSQEEINIGRRSPTRGIAPEIDLAGAPEDPAISHLHAILLRQQDGSYSLVDQVLQQRHNPQRRPRADRQQHACTARRRGPDPYRSVDHRDYPPRR